MNISFFTKLLLMELVFLLPKRKNSKQKTEYVKVFASISKFCALFCSKLASALIIVCRIIVCASFSFINLASSLIVGYFKGIFSFFVFLARFICGLVSGKTADQNTKNVFRLSHALATASAVIVVVGTIYCFSNMTFAVKVNYGGSVIGYVENENVVDQAVEIMSSNIASDNASLYIYDTKLSMGVTTRSNVESAEQIAKTAIESTNELKPAYGLYINDVLYTVCDDKSSIENSLSEILEDKTNTDSSKNVNADFVQDVKISTAYYPADSVISNDDIERIVKNDVLPLSVMVTATETYTESIPYDIETVNDDTKSVGYEKVTVTGAEGIQSVTANVTYVDGVETGRAVVLKQTVTEPIKQVVVCGTKEVIKSSTQKLSASVTSNASMIWPVKSNSKMYISTYFGENGHQGVDITSPAGTDIYAAEDGKVTFAGWGSNGYGYYIVISHGNSTETLYGHCSKILVSVGDTVSAGQVIGAVGSTGQSTGNHLHFEVHVNGSKVNPLGYIK